MDEIAPEFDLELDGFDCLGRGPAATGGVGWTSNPFLSYRCARCGSVMQADNAEDFACDCGAMTLDGGTKQFGSTLGDRNILVYQFRLDIGDLDFE